MITNVPSPRDTLSRLVRFHADAICRYLNDAIHRDRYTGLPFYEWQRMTLYHLTDALSLPGGRSGGTAWVPYDVPCDFPYDGLS